MATISLTVGANTVSTTISAADATRVLAAIQGDRNSPATVHDALVYVLSNLMDQINSRVLAFEAKQLIVTPILPTPIV